MKPTYLMIVDLLPSSRIDIAKYLSSNDVFTYPDIYRENKFRIKCNHDIFCGLFNELVMMKDLKRDDEIIIKHKLDVLTSKIFIFENSHISNLVYCKISNKKLFKYYMKEFKKRRNNWKYQAIVIKKKSMIKNLKEDKLMKELMVVLKQCQIDYVLMDKWKTIVALKKEILNQVKQIIESCKNGE